MPGQLIASAVPLHNPLDFFIKGRRVNFHGRLLPWNTSGDWLRAGAKGKPLIQHCCVDLGIILGGRARNISPWIDLSAIHRIEQYNQLLISADIADLDYDTLSGMGRGLIRCAPII